jgi:hypothetical protein
MIPILPWGGSVLGMIISLKNNARPKRRPFNEKREKDRLIYKTHRALRFKKVSKEKLESINAKYGDSIEKEDSKRLITISLIIAFFGVIGIIGGIQYYNTMKKENARITAQNRINNRIREEAIASAPQEKFDYLLSSAKKYLSKQHFSYAKHQFQEALLIKPNDYNANLGLVASYVYACKQYQTECEEAEGYLIQALGRFGRKEQLVKLETAFYGK